MIILDCKYQAPELTACQLEANARVCQSGSAIGANDLASIKENNYSDDITWE